MSMAIKGSETLIALLFFILVCNFVNSQVSLVTTPVYYTLPQLLQLHPLVYITFYPSKNPCPECDSYSKLFDEVLYEMLIEGNSVIYGITKVPEITYPYTAFYANGQVIEPFFSGPLDKFSVKKWLQNQIKSYDESKDNNEDNGIYTLSADDEDSNFEPMKRKRKPPVVVINANPAGGTVSSTAINPNGDAIASSSSGGGGKGFKKGAIFDKKISRGRKRKSRAKKRDRKKKRRAKARKKAKKDKKRRRE